MIWMMVTGVGFLVLGANVLVWALCRAAGRPYPVPPQDAFERVPETGLEPVPHAAVRGAVGGPASDAREGVAGEAA